jgi:DNA-binding transcriptional ArsR family regulator
VDRLALITRARPREILRLVWDGPLPVSEIAARTTVTISAVSQHLANLHEAGLVTVHKNGRQRLYEAAHDALGELAPLLEVMWRADLDRLAEHAETTQRHRRARR